MDTLYSRGSGSMWPLRVYRTWRWLRSLVGCHGCRGRAARHPGGGVEASNGDFQFMGFRNNDLEPDAHFPFRGVIGAPV